VGVAARAAKGKLAILGLAHGGGALGWDRTAAAGVEVDAGPGRGQRGTDRGELLVVGQASR